jgi:hypothetical protein
VKRARCFVGQPDMTGVASIRSRKMFHSVSSFVEYSALFAVLYVIGYSFF